MAIHAQKGRGSPSTPATQAKMEIHAPSVYGEGRGWPTPPLDQLPDKLELLQFVGKLFRQAEESPACWKSFPTGCRVSSPSEDDSDELEPAPWKMIPMNWRLSSLPEDDSDELERLQAFERYSQQAGEAPGLRKVLPTSWRGSRPSEGTPDELERLQAFGRYSRCKTQKWL
ncbi:hypothetical protein PSTG_06701 [Puccinia striiformis f. sp. tritici PST-78]|uniref:Uncharacterized protein n=1 Tax=Puccinia striiformis f. sp. tritici PST-78 TaxID=1165861 RepID=A0A0L0VM56_9BASI|nr:hypothetical protein PSTG_06701 [Puccinia striiformis f. sp. tritici PST-78]